MDSNTLFSFVFLLGVLLSSFSQTLLKKSTVKNGSNGIRAYLNPLVIISYTIFVLATLLSLLCLKFIPLSKAPVLDSASYIFVAVLSRIFFKENLNAKKIVGFVFIVAGIFVASL